MSSDPNIGSIERELSSLLEEVAARSPGEASWLAQVLRDVVGEARDLYAGATQQSADLEAREELFRAVFLRLGGLGLQRLFEVRKERGYTGASIACDCGKRARFVGYRALPATTLVGIVQLARAYYHCAECRRGSFPLDVRLGLKGSRSPGVQRICGWLSANEIFGEVSEILEKVGGVRVSETWTREFSKDLGQAWEESTHLEVARDREDPWAHREGVRTPERLYIEADGASIHLLDGWHEVKVGCVFETKGSGENQERGRTRFVAGLETSEVFFWRLYSAGCAEAAHGCREIVAIGDGAPWIWNGFSTHFPQAVQIVDWYHAKEHVWAVARACYGEGTQRATRWAEQLETKLWRGDVEAVLRSMRALRPATHEARDAVRTNIDYFDNNKTRMRYGEFRRKGYYIGSGVVESACKQLVALRCKRSSMRWSRIGAQAILRLRCSLLSGTFQNDWVGYRRAS